MHTTHSRFRAAGALFASVAVLSLTIGCGASSSTARSDRGDKQSDPTSSNSTDGSGSQSAESGGTSSKGAKKLEFENVSPRSVTSLQYLAGKLAIGFSDGAIAFVDGSGQVSHSKVAKVHAVAAVAPNGELALLSAKPPVVVNTKGDLILQMNTVPSFESAAFGNDGVTLYVADKAGKVRIWGQAHSFEEDQHKEKLENYLNRQAPDFHVEFGSISGPIHMTESNKLVVVEKEGKVQLWDPTRPSGSKRLMLVGGGARSIASADGYVFVTSMTGALKVGKEEGGYLPWSKDARAGFVATNNMAAGSFFTLDTGKLESRNTQSGEVNWSASLPDGFACGLALSPDGNTLAACIGNFVATFDTKTGAPIAHGYRAEADFTWKR